MSLVKPLIEFNQVGIQFGSLIIHRDISFTVSPGESITILGPSGTGKTLILKMIAGLLRPTQGEVLVMGSNLCALSPTQLQEVRRNIGVLFQGAALFDSLSVGDNIAYGLVEAGDRLPEEIEHIVDATLEIVGLPGIAHKYPSQLSGGQKKRVGLARALASSPRIILLDEPTTGLDPTATRLIDELIVKLNTDYGMTIIAVTHDIGSATRVSKRWLLVDGGKVLADGPTERIRTSHKEVIEFISGKWRDD